MFPTLKVTSFTELECSKCILAESEVFYYFHTSFFVNFVFQVASLFVLEELLNGMLSLRAPLSVVGSMN